MAAQASGRVLRLLPVTDSHCHVRTAASFPEEKPTDDAKKLPFMCHIVRAVVCGTHPDVDWDTVAASVAVAHSSQLRMSPTLDTTTEPTTSPAVIPGFGIHPWFVPNDPACTVADSAAAPGGTDAAVGCPHDKKESERSAEELLCLLEAALKRHPSAIVGEIGLDKLRGPSESAQLPLFVAQLKLAAKYGRPVSVHCVRSFGRLLQTLQELPAEDTPPAIVLHGFTGSLDFARSAMMIRKRRLTSTGGGQLATKKEPLRIFFGVGASTSLRVKDFAKKTLPFLLRERRMLLETDAYHTLLQPPSPQLDSDGVAAQSPAREMRSGEGGTMFTKWTASLTVAAGCELVWNAASCEQLAHLITQVCGCKGDDGDISMVEGLLSESEEAYTKVFIASTPIPAVATH
ncbi:Cut9 interacting protein Scn1 [Trypanosoma cruzi]|nr:Cut9 interacting protein Scn1 [Trypanosoma cruzi]